MNTVSTTEEWRALEYVGYVEILIPTHGVLPIQVAGCSHEQNLAVAGQVVLDHRLAALVPQLIKALEALEPYLTTEAQMLDYAALNDGRASGYDTACIKARVALATAKIAQDKETQ